MFTSLTNSRRWTGLANTLAFFGASELDPDIKIMFITGFAAVALNSDSATPKNAKVLSKPVHLRELVSEVGKMLAA